MSALSLSSQELAPSSATSSRCCGEVADLAAIFDADVNVCVLRRPGIEDLVRVGVAALEPSWRWIGEVDGARWTGKSLLVAMPSAMRDWAARTVVDDVRLWAEVLGEITGATSIGVRLQALEAPMCPRFHVDQVSVRLVTTYLGPGTEWLDERDVDRRWLGHSSRGAPDEHSGLIRRGAVVHAMATCDVGLFKGEVWPGNAGRGAVHRSPAGTAPRLVLTVDPLE